MGAGSSQRKKLFTKFSKERNYTILLLGQTGSGKTSLLNLLAAYRVGLPALEDHVLTSDDLSSFVQSGVSNKSLENALDDPMASKTSDASVYQFQLAQNCYITVIDTPGFGDSRGLKEDERHVSRIMACLSKVNTIDCVLVTMNGREARMNAIVKYVLSQLTSIMPKCVLQQVVVAFTNSATEDDKNFDDASLAEVGLADPPHCCLDNPFGMIQKAIERKGGDASQLANQSVRKYSRQIGDVLRSLETLFWQVHEFQPVPSIRFAELNEKREQIEACLANMVQKMSESNRLIQDLQTHLERIQQEGRVQPLTRTLHEWRLERNKFLTNHYICHAAGCHSNCYKSEVPFPFASLWTWIMQDTACEVCGHNYAYHLISRNGWTANTRIETLQLGQDLNEASRAVQEKCSEAAAEQAALARQLDEKLEEYSQLGMRDAYLRLLRAQQAMLQQQLQTDPSAKGLKDMLDLVSRNLKEAENAAESLCSICCENLPDTKLSCGHQQFCYDCSHRCGTCPICRRVVTGRTRMFSQDMAHGYLSPGSTRATTSSSASSSRQSSSSSSSR